MKDFTQRLELGDFGAVREALVAETNRRSGYKAKGSLPSDAWRERINKRVVGNHRAARGFALRSILSSGSVLNAAS